ncbi:DUF2024 family protein [Bowmanella denitrificans]|uniref:DUF2024 family protein n=1 Tax=Bowmanella denitrificans TaxID=366582 RepID=A0ABP3HJJ4_9ALTE
MQVLVYDTHVHTKSGAYYHFDVLVTEDARHRAGQFADAYLRDIGVHEAEISQQRCDFCHAEMANAAVRSSIEQQGFAIIPMQGCPSGD